jgi:hypothetical protein
MKIYNREVWHSLGDLKNAIQREDHEHVVLFDGYQIITDKHKYTLAFGKVCKTELLDT